LEIFEKKINVNLKKQKIGNFYQIFKSQKWVEGWEETSMITANIWMKSLFKCCEIFQKQLIVYQI